MATTSNSNTYIRWVLIIAAIFSHWPFNIKATNIAQVNQLTTSATDWIRLLIVVVVQSIFMWFEIYVDPLASAYQSSLEHHVVVWCLCSYLVTGILSPAIGICTRNHLSKILSINRDFDAEVSVEEIPPQFK